MIIGITHKICGLCGERLIIKIMHFAKVSLVDDYLSNDVDDYLSNDGGKWYLGYECSHDGPYGRVSIRFRHKCQASDYLYQLLENGDTSKLRKPDYSGLED